MSRFLRIPKQTGIRIYKALRILASKHLTEFPIRLGGPGIVCAIDETLMSFKPKYNRGRAVDRQIWCFGIVDTIYRPAKGYLQVVPDRSAATLLPIIADRCRAGTIIHSDQWAAYRGIRTRLGLDHETVNHSLNFVDPESGCHTQHIESFWNRIKRRIKAMNGLTNRSLILYLAEFMWKDNYRGRALFVLIGMLHYEG